MKGISSCMHPSKTEWTCQSRTITVPGFRAQSKCMSTPCCGTWASALDWFVSVVRVRREDRACTCRCAIDPWAFLHLDLGACLHPFCELAVCCFSALFCAVCLTGCCIARPPQTSWWHLHCWRTRGTDLPRFPHLALGTMFTCSCSFNYQWLTCISKSCVTGLCHLGCEDVTNCNPTLFGFFVFATKIPR